MSLESVVNNARSGLTLVNRQLAQTADNVANAGTDGYTRKVVAGYALTAGGQGIGVRSLEMKRDVDNALLASINASRAQKAGATVRQEALKSIELAHGDPSNSDSLGDLIGSLRSSLVALRDSPAETPQQGKVVAAAQDVVSRLHSLTSAINETRQQAQDELVNGVASLNEQLASIAQLTDQIRASTSSGQAVAGLEDQRDAAIARISELIQVRAVRADDGGITLIARGGIVLPVDGKSAGFSVDNASVGPDAYYGAGGSLPGVKLNGIDVTAQLVGGTLAEHVRLRDETLPKFQAELDIAAGQLAQRFDTQGLTLFVDGDGASLPDMSLGYTASGLVGFAGSIRVNPAVVANNTLVRDGTRDVSSGEGGASSFTTNPAGGPASFTTLIDRVLQFTFGTETSTGTAQPGYGTTNLGPGGNLNSSLTTSVSLEDYAALLTASQTGARSDAQSLLDTQNDLLTALETRFEDQSGVDIDTEMSNLVTLQTAYSANARILSVVQSMYDALFAIRS